MPTNPFSFLSQAISELLNSKLTVFESSGLNLFRGLAVIILVWFGLKAALSSAQSFAGFNFAKFADLLLVISFGLAMQTYYGTPMPGIGYSFSDLVTKETQYLSNQIESDQADQISTAITTAEEQLGSPPGVFSFHEELTRTAISQNTLVDNMDKRYRHRVGVRAEICFDLVLDSSDLTPEQLRDAVAVALNKSADDERGFPVPILLDGKVFPEWNSVDPEMEPMHVLDPQSVRSLDCFEIHSPERSKVQ